MAGDTEGYRGGTAYAVVVSPQALQSTWVGKELKHALVVQKQRGKGEYPLIPLSLNGTQLGVLEQIFGEEPIFQASLLQQLAADPKLPNPLLTFISALQAIVAGSRDLNRADAPELDYMMATELLFLIETLERGRQLAGVWAGRGGVNSARAEDCRWRHCWILWGRGYTPSTGVRCENLHRCRGKML